VINDVYPFSFSRLGDNIPIIPGDCLKQASGRGKKNASFSTGIKEFNWGIILQINFLIA
jgi:hypothetical protein